MVAGSIGTRFVRPLTVCSNVINADIMARVPKLLLLEETICVLSDFSFYRN